MLTHTRAPARTRIACLAVLIISALVPERAPAEDSLASSVRACALPQLLGRLGCQLHKQLSPLPPDTMLAVKPIRGLPSESEPERFRERLRQVLAGQLGLTHTVNVKSLTEARFLARDSPGFLLLDSELKSGQMHMAASHFPVSASFWGRVKNPSPSLKQHAFAHGRMDAEVSSFLPPVKLAISQVKKADTKLGRVHALACGDLDGDGSLELAAVSRHEIALGRIQGDRFAVTKRIAWSALSPVAPAPLRQPIVQAWLQPHAYLDVGSSDRADLVRLSPQFQKRATASGKLPWPGRGCVKRKGSALSAQLVECFGPKLLREFELGGSVDTTSGATIVNDKGEQQRVAAVRYSEPGQLRIINDSGRQVEISDGGAQVAIGDINRDGLVDIAVSSNTLQPSEDQLKLYTWRKDGRVTLHAQLPVPSGIHALALCPADGPGIGPIALATDEQLWVLQ